MSNDMSQATWKDERRRRQAEIIRQHRPWERSTGPRTEQGKARSARNADKGLGWPQLRVLRQLLRKIPKTSWGYG